MSKTNETPKLGPATPKDRRLLDDTELNAVTGGSGVNHSEFTIVKLCDAATPKLFWVASTIRRRFYKALAVFLADRLREMEHRLSGNDGQDLAAEAILKDQLDDAILDNVSMAGDRFDRMLKVLTGV